MTEGHNLVTQNLLREQPTHTGNINLVNMVCDLLIVQCGEHQIVR